MISLNELNTVTVKNDISLWTEYLKVKRMVYLYELNTVKWKEWYLFMNWIT